MELTFEKIGDWYISEFEVTSDFNLHIEKEPKGDFYLYQRTSSSGQYDIIEDFGYKKGGDNVIDLDFQALVYPKWIKIKSAVKPLIATITTDGEVNEVSYQAKDIEITSNGTTKVTADTGYTALGSVNVKVNVPTEGGGSGVKADDIIWLINMYAEYPTANLTTNTVISGTDESNITQITPIPENVLSGIASTIIYSSEMMLFSNCKIVSSSISNYPCSVSNICVECELEDGSVNVYHLGYSDIRTDGTSNAHSYIVDSKGCGITNVVRIKRIFIEGGNEYIIKETE